MSLHVFHEHISGVYCHDTWYKCKPGSFEVDAYEVQVSGEQKDAGTKGFDRCDWVLMSEYHPDVNQACSGASWIDPKTGERVSVFMSEITAFREVAEEVKVQKLGFDKPRGMPMNWVFLPIAI